jgi:hypothetical protein
MLFWPDLLSAKPFAMTVDMSSSNPDAEMAEITGRASAIESIIVRFMLDHQGRRCRTPSNDLTASRESGCEAFSIH